MSETTASTSNYLVTRKSFTVVKNVSLNGVKSLNAEKVTSTLEVTHKRHYITKQPYMVVGKKAVNEIVEPISFNLIEVTPAQLKKFRMSGIPSFVLKKNGKLYYTSIPKNLSFVSSPILGKHLCAIQKHECKHLSAASDELGGCAKVREGARRIERYPWITTGYETFNTQNDSFVVVNCSHYEQCPPPKKLPARKTEHDRLRLAQFMWDDVKSNADIAQHIEVNHRRNGFIY